MSVRLMAQVWQLDLPGHLKLTLLAVADHANDDGWAYPGQASLAAKVSCSERQVRAHLAELEQLGVLERHRRGKQRTNLYRVVPSPQAVDGPVDRPDFTVGDRQPAAGGDRQPTAAVTGSPPPLHRNRQTTTSRNQQPERTRDPGALHWASRWAQLRQVPATQALLGTWAAQVEDFCRVGGQVTDQLLARAHARGIEQPAGWAFVVEGVQAPWPAWLPAYLQDAANQPGRQVDPRWEREYSYGPQSTPPPDKAAVIRAKGRLQQLARDGTHVTEQLVQQVLADCTQEVRRG